MEEPKLDKRSKEYKDSLVPEKTQLERLIESGIPIVSAEFQSAVNNGDKTPENAFSILSDKKSRKVQMWLCAGGSLVICKHKDAQGRDKFFYTPAANTKFGNFN